MNSSSKEKHYNSYDEEPVFYCRGCLSLNIKSLSIDGMGDMEYCDECGSTDIGQCDIAEWEELYRQKYNKEYIDRSDNKKKHVYFKY